MRRRDSSSRRRDFGGDGEKGGENESEGERKIERKGWRGFETAGKREDARYRSDKDIEVLWRGN